MKKKIWLSTVSIVLSCSIIAPVICNTVLKKENSTTSLKKEQIKQFENIDHNLINDFLNNEELITTQYNQYSLLKEDNIENDKNLLPNTNISTEVNQLQYKQLLKNNIDQIISGELLIYDLQEKYNKAVNNNPSFIEQYGSVNEFSEQNFYSDYVTYAEIPDYSNDYLSIEELIFLKKLPNIIQNLHVYSGFVTAFAITTTTFTAISWAVAATYWASWWMFGANVPFAIASTLQAITLTTMTADAWINLNGIKQDISLLSYIRSLSTTAMNEQIPILINAYMNDNDSFLDLMLSSLENIVFSDAIWNMKYKIASLGMQKLTHLFERSIANKLRNYSANLITQKILLMSTMWANPLVTVINTTVNVMSYIEIGLLSWRFIIDRI